MSRITLLIAAASVLLAFGPCGPIPGGSLSGIEGAGPVSSWAFLDEVPRCEVEVRPESPHSVTVNCMSWNERGFVSCSDCEGKTWSGYALQNPVARVRAADEIYPVLLSRVEDRAVLDGVWLARLAKINKPPVPRPMGWWTFEFKSR